MQGKSWFVVISVLVLAASGCRERNPYLCPGGIDCPVPGGPCSSSDECGAPTPVCNVDTMICVQCMEDRHCRSGEVCDQNICAECTEDANCPSGLCLADKTCAGLDEVAYVDAAAAATNATCTKEAPCATLAKALGLIPTPKYIRATGMLVTDAAITINKSIIIYGDPGRTKITRSTDGEVLILKGMDTPQIDLFNLEIEGNPGNKECVKIHETASVTMTEVDVHGQGENGIRLEMLGKLVVVNSQIHDNKLDGVRALAGTTLELRGSRIYNNSSGTNVGAGVAGVNASSTAMVTIDSSIITANAGASGGVSINGPFTIRNSIIAINGDLGMTTSAGGLTLNPGTATATAQFEFNTIADNRSVSGIGMTCTLIPVAVSNSIITGNNAPANCTISYSLFTTGATGTNKNGAPMFKSKNFGDPGFYRIGSASDAINSADPAATLNVDIDGDARNDGRKDMGADEFK
jgi:Cys-rich repeat protein